MTFEDVVAKLEPELRRMASQSRLSRCDVEDALQDVLIILWEQLKSGDEIQNLSGWLVRVFHRKRIDYIRRDIARRKRLRIYSSCNGAISCEPFESLQKDENAVAVKLALNAIPNDAKLLVTMRYVDELNVDEISRRLGISESAVWSRLRRVKSALARELKGSIT